MSDKANMELMDKLHGAVATELLKRVQDDEATGADFSNAIKFLKDNGVEATVSASPAVQSLASQFPTFDDEHTHTTN